MRGPWRVLARYRMRIARAVVAGAGLVLAVRAPGPAGSGLRVVSVIVCFGLAAGLHLLRVPEEGLPDALRLREWHRVVGRWGSVGLAVGGVLAFVDASAGLAVGLFWCAPLPRLAEQLVWRAWPGQVVRAARSAELAQEIAKARGLSRVPLDFDEDSGAHGLPKPQSRQPGGLPSAKSVSNRSLSWDGSRLHVLGHSDRGHRDSSLEPREAVWVLASRAGEDGSGGALLLLDASGYSLLTVHEMRCPLHSVGPVVRAAGLPFSVYDLGTGRRRAQLIAELFPPAMRSAGERN
ncbi:hypothetical protein [Kitasatospora sp. MAA4]|uniref:hypothetical protein n=1 Tax=Kitasatospora sp. MAA4 TaxID=3035093 RepID=UPI0024747A81|nr:hypothetical protein [Kitasatospora sp. MAA4]